MDNRKLFVGRVFVVLAIGVILVCAIYITLRLQILYTLQTELAILTSEQINQRAKDEQIEIEANTRLDQIERILFGDVIAKLEKQNVKPSWVEQWQRNRDKELRDRIAAIERRVYALENKR